MGRTLEKHRLFDEVVFVAVDSDDLPSAASFSSAQRVVRLIPSKHGISRVRHLVLWSRSVYRYALSSGVTCINCHSLSVLPVCVLIKRKTGAALIYDTHELESKPSSAGTLRKAVYRVLERALMPFVDLTLVVNTSIRDWYRATYPGAPVFEVINYPSVEQQVDAGIELRSQLGIPAHAQLFLYQGVLGHGRGVRVVLDAFTSEALRGDGVERHMVFMGEGSLAAEVDAAAAAHGHIHRIPMVAPQAVLSMTRQADVTLSIGEPVSESYVLSLPNKLLESLACEVPMIATDGPEYRRALADGAYGWLIAPTVEGLVGAILEATPEQVSLRRQALRGWWQTHNWESQEESLVGWYAQYAHVTARPTSPTP